MFKSKKLLGILIIVVVAIGAYLLFSNSGPKTIKLAESMNSSTKRAWFYSTSHDIEADSNLDAVFITQDGKGMKYDFSSRRTGSKYPTMQDFKDMDVDTIAKTAEKLSKDIYEADLNYYESRAKSDPSTYDSQVSDLKEIYDFNQKERKLLVFGQTDGGSTGLSAESFGLEGDYIYTTENTLDSSVSFVPQKTATHVSNRPYAKFTTETGNVLITDISNDKNIDPNTAADFDDVNSKLVHFK